MRHGPLKEDGSVARARLVLASMATETVVEDWKLNEYGREAGKIAVTGRDGSRVLDLTFAVQPDGRISADLVDHEKLAVNMYGRTGYNYRTGDFAELHDRKMVTSLLAALSGIAKRPRDAFSSPVEQLAGKLRAFISAHPTSSADAIAHAILEAGDPGLCESVGDLLEPKPPQPGL